MRDFIRPARTRSASDNGLRQTLPRLSDLSTFRRQLVGLMSDIGFGAIECLSVVAGEPRHSTQTRVVREHHLGARSSDAVRHLDFALVAQVVELFSLLDEIRNGEITRLEIRHGLPHRAFTSTHPEGDRWSR